MKFTTKEITMAGLMAAIVCAVTYFGFTLPVAGYIHLGEGLVYTAGILLGPVLGGIAAALGSILADLFLGYGVYVPATFVIKGLNAFVVGWLFHKLVKKEHTDVRKILTLLAITIVPAIFVVGGYFSYEVFLYDTTTASANIAYNLLQVSVGSILVIPLMIAIDKARLIAYKK